MSIGLSTAGGATAYAVAVAMARAQEVRTSFSADLASAGAARRFVASKLAAWSCDSLTDSALLLVSELVTNAVLHGRSALDLVLRLSGDRLRIEVHDTSDARPVRKQYSLEAGTGRGLMLVEQMSQEWGVVPTPGKGKVVWCELDRRAGPSDLASEDVDLDALERMLLGGADAGSDKPRDPSEEYRTGPRGHRALLLVGAASR